MKELESLHNKFKSGNSIPVGQAVVTRAEYEALQAELDAYKAHVAELTSSLATLCVAHHDNTGHEPSLSVFHRSVDESRATLKRSPVQSLRTIQAQAVTDLISECAYATQVNGIATSIIDVDSAISYADRLGEG